MPRYDLVANAIDSLSNRIHGASQDKMAHQQRMNQIGLQNARLGLEAQQMRGIQDVKMAQLERDKYLDELTTIGEAISTSKLPEAQKKAFLSQMKPEMASLPTTRRKAAETFFEAFKARQKASTETAKQKSDIEQKELDRKNRLDVARLRNQGKPTDQLKRIELQAWKDYLDGKATPRQEKLIKVDKDPYLKDAIQLVQGDDTMYGKPVNEVAKRATEVAKGLRERASQEGPKETEKPKELTRDIAIEYMRKAGGDKQKAIKMAQDDGYPVYEDMTK